MKKNKKNNNSSNNITTILLSVIIAILVIILIIVLVKDNNQDNLNTNNTPNYNEETNNNDNNSHTENKEYITKDKALEIALKHAKLNQNDVYDLSVELEYKYNSNVYEIDFNHKYYDYEYYVDAVTGEILHSFKEID